MFYENIMFNNLNLQHDLYMSNKSQIKSLYQKIVLQVFYLISK
jgi:hypothetical protein